MIEKKRDSLCIWLFEKFLQYEAVGHFVSTRIGGHSCPPYDSLNLSFNIGDNPENVLKNRELFFETLEIPLSSLTTAKQIHDGHVKIVSERLRGKGSTDYKGAINKTDAMVTNVPGTCLMILLADCVPVLFYDPSKKVIGVAHAGWRGTLQMIAQKTVKVFQQHFGCSPQNILAGIGPSIGPCCYEVGREVISNIKHVFGTEQDWISKESEDGKGHFDLWTANLKQLMEAGIPEKNIEMSRTCTCDHADLFFSYRHDRGMTGRFGAGIIIR